MTKFNIGNLCIIGFMLLILILLLLRSISYEKFTNNNNIIKLNLLRLMSLINNDQMDNQNNNQYSNLIIDSSLDSNGTDYIVSGRLDRRLRSNVNQLSNAELISRLQLRLSDDANPAVVNLNDNVYRITNLNINNNSMGSSRNRDTINTDPFTDLYRSTNSSFDNPFHEALDRISRNAKRGGIRNSINNNFPRLERKNGRLVLAPE